MTAGGEFPDQTPFADLPAALVEEVLNQTATVADGLLASFQKIREDRNALRKKLEESGLVITESSLGYPPLPTTCATDGSYAIDRLLTIDLAAAAAVAVEGLTPPSEKRHWELPHHKTFIAAEPHLEDTATVLRAVMLGEELLLSTSAPHDVVMIDGTLTLPIIYFNQALNKVLDAKELRCSAEFLERCDKYLTAYLELLRSERSDKHYIALPKYSTRREIGTRLGWPTGHDDRGMLTLLLDPGEFTTPVELEHPRDSEGRVTWHLNTGNLPNESRKKVHDLANEIVFALQTVKVFYYKPHDWLPALRVEVAASVASNKHRLATVVQGLKHQCATPSMLEPYPIYLADRTAKALARAIPAFRQVTTQQVSERYNGDIGEVFFALHGYRSESGR
ncbi:DNA double-strand break repair nuclease NurA [Pyrinomonas methylaliphatogenes]|uniref:NurA domain-containing protein n=1 Tax=Pyrinomonas methylaliphatogenes TaxID=454194 RepID=A0A0B6WST1_9BACT|nr:DNA double-strand break repair nuclease NurA [Pyrinomonas methylaliphatogenes]CDM64056.1 NurA domain-containing protein [Pyrinomonas methylaliphatogenes]